MSEITDKEEIQMQIIADVVCFVKGISQDELKSKTKRYKVASSKFLFCYLVSRSTKININKTSKWLNLTWASVKHGIEQQKQRIDIYDSIYRETKEAEILVNKKLTEMRNKESKLINTQVGRLIREDIRVVLSKYLPETYITSQTDISTDEATREEILREIEERYQIIIDNKEITTFNDLYFEIKNNI